MIAETWFHQSGYITLQQTTYCMTEDPLASHSQEVRELLVGLNDLSWLRNILEVDSASFM
jgi:hypothetical protein